MAVVREIDFSDSIVKVAYPNILLPAVNQTTPLVVKLLEAGGVPLIGELSGNKKVIARISPSAYNIDKLIRTHSDVAYADASGKEHRLNSVEDYLEVAEWTC